MVLLLEHECILCWSTGWPWHVYLSDLNMKVVQWSFIPKHKACHVNVFLPSSLHSLLCFLDGLILAIDDEPDNGPKEVLVCPQQFTVHIVCIDCMHCHPLKQKWSSMPMWPILRCVQVLHPSSSGIEVGPRLSSGVGRAESTG